MFWGRTLGGGPFLLRPAHQFTPMREMPITLRLAVPGDLAAVDALLQRSYPRLLAPDYPPSVMVTAVPLIARARPELLASGRYFLAVGDGKVVGAGGYSLAAPAGRGAPEGDQSQGTGHIRHVATDPGLVRRGIGSALLRAVFAAAAQEGVEVFECLSTRTAEAFYATHGFRRIGLLDIPLADGIRFPAIRMVRRP
jgi:GNAT superfamily N-acetyltransferase